MTDADILSLLNTDLGFIQPDAARATQLQQLIAAAVAFIQREGLALSAPYTVEQAQIIEMYAAYLFRKRDTGDGMPRMLRWALNNAILAQSGGGGSAAQ